MANVKISGLPAASAVADANEFEINEAGTSKKVTGSQIASYVDAELAPLKSADIGSTVQAYDADTTKNDVANTFTANQVISVTDNSNAALRVTQEGTGNAIVVEDSTNPDGSPFVVSSSGAVGIGASSPSKKLQVADTSGSLQLSLTNGTNELLIGANATEGRIYTFQSIPIISYTNNTERMRITSSGGVSFGSSGTAYGTSGQVLTSNGNAPPTWADASGGGAWEVISRTVLSNDASVIYDFGAYTNYDGFKIVFNNVIPSSDNVALNMFFGQNGASFDTLNGNGQRIVARNVNTLANDSNEAEILSFSTDVGSAANEDGVFGELSISGSIAKTTERAIGTALLSYIDNGTASKLTIASFFAETDDEDSIQLKFSSGNLESGTLTLLGLKQS